MNHYEIENPFYRSYLFSRADIKRVRLTFTQRMSVIFRPMLHQITSDGLAVSFKATADGRFFIFEIEEFK